MNYNLISVDNSQVPKTNTNTISALSLVSALEAKDQQLQKLKNELASFNQKQPSLHYVAEFAGNQFFNMQTTQTYNFSTIEIFARVAYRIVLTSGSITRNFADVLESGATNFNFSDYNIKIGAFYVISGPKDIGVSIDRKGTGLNIMAAGPDPQVFSGEIFFKFNLTKKLQTVTE